MDNQHEYALFDENVEKISTGYFSGIEVANEKAREWLGENASFTVRDLDEEWEAAKALELRNQIKKCRSSLRKSQIIVDMNTYYNVKYDEVVHFHYMGKEYIYRTWLNGDEWIEKLQN